MKIEWDKERNIISVGKAEFSQYTKFKNSATFASEVLRSNNINLQVYNTKDRNKEVGDMLGCSRAVLFRHFDKLQKKAFITPIYDVLKKVSKFQGGRGFDSYLVSKINKHKEKLQEVYDDGLYHLLPLVTVTGKTPKELKEEHKAVWKILSKNSLHRNKALVKNYKNISKGSYKIPTTLLAYPFDTQTLSYLANNFKGKWSNKKEMVGHARLFLDTQRMAQQLDKKVDENWTSRRLKEEHDSMSQEITAKKYSKNVFEALKDILVKEFEFEGYVATLLDSAFAIADEGNAMGHCVASYAESSKIGRYLVYSVRKDGVRTSTVGVRVKDGGNGLGACGTFYYILDQHYAKYNYNVKDENELDLGKEIVKTLNEEWSAAL